MRIVLDANVVVAAFAARGLCEAVFELCLDSHEILVSQGLLAEIERNLRKKVKLPSSAADEIVRLLRENCTLAVPAALPKETCRDPDDVHVLGLAVAGEAEYLVTGDSDLLILKKHGDCHIVTPRDFSTLIRGKK